MDIFKVYKKLLRHYGHQNWWPTIVTSDKLKVSNGKLQVTNHKLKNDPYFEIAIGAILTQNTYWKNVESALKCLINNKLLTAGALIKCPTIKLQKCLRSSGYYKQKTKKIKIFSRWLIKNYQGNLKNFFKKPLSEARQELLGLWGVGPETADSILLYAGNKPIFVIDAYTKRLCRKFGIQFKTYGEYQHFFTKKLKKSKKSVKLYNEFHALIVVSGKDGHKIFK